MRPTPLPCSKLYSRQTECSTTSPSWLLLLVLFLYSSFFFLLTAFFFLLSSYFFVTWILIASCFFSVTWSLIASCFFFVTWSLIASLYLEVLSLLLYNLKSYRFFFISWSRKVLLKREQDGTSVAGGQDKRVVLQVLILMVRLGAVWM